MPNATPPAAWRGLRDYVDWGNFHPYPYNGDPFVPPLRYGGLDSFFLQGDFPSVAITAAPNAFTAYRDIYGTAPMAATETGYPTARDFTPEALVAKYLPRLYAEFFRLGIKRTFVYQLLDFFDDPKNLDPEASFGLLRHDLSERPAFATVAALARLLAEPRGPGGAVPPDFALTLRLHGQGAFGDPSHVHHLLLSRRDGTLLLLLWNEVSGEDLSPKPRRPITVPPLPARLEANTALRFVVDGSDAGRASGVDLAIEDRILAIAIGR
jgi:hypothetical protein